jgi:hypothetical protein
VSLEVIFLKLVANVSPLVLPRWLYFFVSARLVRVMNGTCAVRDSHKEEIRCALKSAVQLVE